MRPKTNEEIFEPFGSVRPSPVAVSALAQGACERAARLLAKWREGKDRPPPQQPTLRFGTIEVLIGILVLGALAAATYVLYLYFTRPKPDGVFLYLAGFCGGFGALLALVGWFNARRKAPTTPQIAVRNYYAALKARDFDFAAACVCPLDFDGAPRTDPARVDDGAMLDARLASPVQMAGYWKEAAKAQKVALSALEVTDVAVHPVLDDICIAEVGLQCVTTSAWSIVTLAVGFVVNNRRTWTLPRALVRNGDQWLMLSAEWLSLAELDFSWLEDAAKD